MGGDRPRVGEVGYAICRNRDGRWSILAGFRGGRICRSWSWRNHSRRDEKARVPEDGTDVGVHRPRPPMILDETSGCEVPRAPVWHLGLSTFPFPTRVLIRANPLPFNLLLTSDI